MRRRAFFDLVVVSSSSAGYLISLVGYGLVSAFELTDVRSASHVQSDVLLERQNKIGRK